MIPSPTNHPPPPPGNPILSGSKLSTDGIEGQWEAGILPGSCQLGRVGTPGFQLGFFLGGLNEVVHFSAKKTRRQTQEKECIISHFFAEAQELHTRFLCNIYIFICFSYGHRHLPHIFPTTLLHPHLFKKQRKTRKKRQLQMEPL